MDGAEASYGILLSENMELTHEGYLKCFNAVIARTGIQQYRYSDLPQEEAAELGIAGNPSDFVDLHRDPEDVFDPVFMASLEGKDVTYLHPPKLLTIDTVLDHSLGHIADVRPGVEPLDDGNMPLLATLVIKCKNLIAKIQAGLRQLSCGYTYHIALDGNRILQVDMTGNHVAVLPIGRAGPGASIIDGAPTEVIPVADIMKPLTKLERLKHLAALGLKVFSTEATPQELALAGEAMDAAPPAAPAREPRRLVLAPTVERGAATRGTRRESNATAQDEEDRAAAHALVDELIDQRAAETEEADAIMEAAREDLVDLLGAPANDEEDDDDDMPNDEGAEGEDGLTEEERAAAEAEDEGEGADEVIPVGDRPKPAAPGLDGADRGARRVRGQRGAAGMDALEALRKLRPTIARSKDRKVRAAFDAALKAAKPGAAVRGVRRAGAGYDRIAIAAATAADAVPEALESQGAAQTKAYADAKKKLREQSK